MDEALLTGAIRAVQLGDRERFAPIVQRFGPLVAGHVRASGLKGSDLDDVVQQTFVRAWKKLPSLRDPRRFRGWLLTIASNLVRDFLGKRSRERTRMSDLQAVAPRVEEARTTQPSPRISRLQELIPTLKESEREVLALRFAEGKNCRQIAELLGRNHATVRSILHRALKALRTQLEIEEAR